MPRKGPAQRRELTPDPIYRSLVVTQLVNKVMLHGKRTVAETIVYDALKMIEEKTGAEPIATLKRAVDTVRPPLEVRRISAFPGRHQSSNSRSEKPRLSRNRHSRRRGSEKNH